MDPGLRTLFNKHYGESVYRRMTALMQERMDEPDYAFRLAETPLFFADVARAKFESAAREIVAQVSLPEVIEAGEEAVPERWRAPGRDRLPHMVAVDMAVVRGADGGVEPRLIELQGFSSLYGMEFFQSGIWAELLSGIPGMPGRWTSFFSGLDESSYVELLRSTVVGDADPDEVVLLDIDPERQKTRADFHAIRRLLGVRSVGLHDLTRKGRRLFAPKDGRPIPVRRIFHRVVFDELERSDVSPPFDYRDELEVVWVAHPNWYWIWSKHTLPLLRHPSVPETRYLSDVDPLPDDLSRYILKPLFSFAGTGVRIDVDRDVVGSIPEDERAGWILQEKVDYAPAFVAPDGYPVKAEVRMMFLRPDRGDELTLAVNLVRLSRGKMHGVDHNRGLAWVGSSVGIWPQS